MEDKSGQVARDLIPFMQLNLEKIPKNPTKVTLQQQCYRLVPDLLSPNEQDETAEPFGASLNKSTPNSNVDRRPKRRQLPQIPPDKKPFEKLWQIGMSRLDTNKSHKFQQNLERNLRWKLTKANMLLEIKTDPTTGQTVSINIVDDDDDVICDHKANVLSSTLSNVDSGFGGENPPPPTILDWSLIDHTPSSVDYGGIDLDEIMIQTPLQSSSSSQPKQSCAKNSQDDSGLSSSLDSPSVTLNGHQTKSPAATHRALFKFCARHPDEIDLQIGDIVHIHQEFDDQWSEGLNLRTGCKGIFPTALVIDVNYSEFVFENEPTTTSTTTSNINSSTNISANNSWIDFRIQRERFKLDFLGSIEVFKAKGEDVLDESIRRVAGDHGGATSKLAMEIPFHCWLEVSDIGIRMSDCQRSPENCLKHGKHDYFFALVQITYCGYQYKNNLYYFAFITRHPTKQTRFACHVFQSFDNSTKDVAESVGRAFHRFYNRFVQITLPTMDTNSIIP